jgi:prepilin-type processing-associated H-X9-DG protein
MNAKHSKSDRFANYFIAIALVCIVIGMFFPWYPRGGGTPTPQCPSNLRNIGFAFQQFVMQKDHFPSVYTADASGKPLMSWRMAIVPYLGQEDLYRQLDLKDAWNSSKNRPLTTHRIELFQCPFDPDQKKIANCTSYVAIVGPGTVWEVGKKISPSQIRDNLSDTLLVIEMNSSGIAWAEPRDLDLSNLPPGLTQYNLFDHLSNHNGGFEALFADGHIEFIPNTIPWSQFMAILTIAGGEKVDRSTW